MPESRHAHDPDVQLGRLAERCRAIAPHLYQDQARYLDLIRRLLPSAVKSAIRSILCTLSTSQRAALAAGQSALQARIDALVQRSSSMLTVEQLLVLSARMDAEEHRARVEQFQTLASRAAGSVETASANTEPSHTNAPAAGIELGLELPLERPELIDGLLPGASSPDVEEPVDRSEPIETQTLSTSEPGSEMSELDILRSLFVMAGESLEQTDAPEQRFTIDSTDATLQLSSRVNDQLMPSSASGLLCWMDAMDRSLIRRLRNLSHAVNVELMRAGVTRSLLPIQLLDAVISGQLPTQSAPSNLLRLTLPLSMVGDEQVMESVCVLVRPSELEFDDHALRRCRSALRQRRRDLGTWLQKERHWQHRASVQEVQTHWWPNQPETPPSR